ncbi:hypothetical protein [Azotobacter chroococcum]|uniref:hypothetical protein n=1 Tax=Azotobacter chroococcum TaxID=353 RepID=UPI00197A8CE6|nr:hypothetical protein [Azotobacter chroococcum]
MKRRCTLFALLTLTTSLGGCSIHWWGDDDHDHHHQRPWYHWDNGRHEGYERRYEGGQDDHGQKARHESQGGKSKAKGNNKGGGKGNGNGRD